MMENNTDRLFWTLTAIIIGALLLTIGVKIFPNMANAALSPMGGMLKQADVSTQDVGKAVGDNLVDIQGVTTPTTTDNDQTQTNTNANTNTNAANVVTDPDALAKQNAQDATDLGFYVNNNNDGTGTIVGYDTKHGLSVNIPKYLKVNGVVLKITNIGNSAFNNDQLLSITFPDSLTGIGDFAFEFNQLKSVVFPDSLVSIGDNAFQNNVLSSVYIPGSVSHLGEQAFNVNALSTVNIPNTQAYNMVTTNDVFESWVTVTNNS